MKIMKTMKRIRRTAGNICFVAPWLNKTNIFGAGNGKNASCPFISFMFFEVVRTFSDFIAKNMKIMKMYEERLFKGFYLPCYLGRGLPTQKHEANMKKYEEVGMKKIAFPFITADSKRWTVDELAALTIGGAWIVIGLLVVTLGIVIRYFVFGGV